MTQMTVTVVWGFFVPARKEKKENLFVWALVIIKKTWNKGEKDSPIAWMMPDMSFGPVSIAAALYFA